jgi:hypothetical protein
LIGAVEKIVLSASRRTDIPAFYMPWFVDRLKRGWFDVVNPYNQKVRKVPAGPDRVHTIVFWSKNFGPFLKGGYAGWLAQMGYHLFFNVTINSENPLIEPRVPPLRERLDQLERLCERYDPRVINWRFDPLCFYTTKAGGSFDNLAGFERIAERAAGAGIRRCITSFMDHYAKITKRLRAIPGFVFIDPSLEKKTESLYRMHEILKPYGIKLKICCEKTLLSELPDDLPVTPSACIPNDLLAALYGGGISLKKDAGQRVKAGCGCGVSVDVGSYDLRPCYHKCLYCYARPAGS